MLWPQRDLHGSESLPAPSSKLIHPLWKREKVPQAQLRVWTWPNISVSQSRNCLGWKSPWGAPGPSSCVEQLPGCMAQVRRSLSLCQPCRCPLPRLGLTQGADVYTEEIDPSESPRGPGQERNECFSSTTQLFQTPAWTGNEHLAPPLTKK